MSKYIIRLMECGYSCADARKLCSDYITNLSLLDLDNFVYSMEQVRVYRI